MEETIVFSVNRKNLAAGIFLGVCSFLFLLYLSSHHTETGINHDEAYILNLADQIYQGNGFVTPVLWQLYLMPESLPMPYAGAVGPLPSIFIAGCFLLFGVTPFAMHFPGMILGSLIAPATFILALRFELSGWRAFAAGCVTTVHPFLAYNSNKIMTDIPSAAFVLCGFVLLFGRRSNVTNILLGVTWGLAYLCRYQALLFGLVIVASWLISRQLTPRDVGVACAAFTLTVLPWLVRGAVVFGNPFYTHASEYYWLIAHVPEQVQLVRRTTPPPDQIVYLMEHGPTYLAATLGRIKAMVFYTTDVVAPNTALALGCVLGLVRMRKELRAFIPAIIYCGIMVAFFLTSYLEPRYLLSVAPLVVIGGVGGLSFITRTALQPVKHARVLEPLAIVAILCVYMVVDSVRMADEDGKRSFGRRAETAFEARPFFSGFPPWSFAIMATAPEHYALFHRQYAVSLPLNIREDIREIIARYDVRYVVLQDREAAEFESLPEDIRAGFQEVFKGQNVHIIEVLTPDTSLNNLQLETEG